MKERLTRKKDNFPCRINHCSAEDWMVEVTGINYVNWEDDEACRNCPFMNIVNKLAEYEDKEEKMENDLK